MRSSDGEPTSPALGLALAQAQGEIAELRRAVEAYRQLVAGSENAFLFEGAPDPVFALSPDGVYLYANEALTKVYKRPVADIVGHGMGEFFDSAGLAHRLGVLGEVCRTGQPGAIDVFVAGRSWVTSINPLRDASGVVIAALCRSSDVTELRRTTAELRASEARHRRLVESVPGILYSYVEGIGGTFYSPQVEAVLGYTAAHLEAHPTLWRDSVHPDDVAAVDASIAHPVGFEVIYRVRDARGRWRWLLDRGVRITDVSGGVSIEGVAVDVSEIRQAQLDNERLELQLHQAQKLESVGRLAGGVAHDFNNMLGVILAHADLAMAQATTGSPITEDLREIKAAAERSARLTQQLLAFARRQPVAPVTLDLNVAVSGMSQMLRRLLGENLALEWRPGARLWSVKADPSQIDQVLTNLCVNARDAVAGVGRLTIETANVTFDEAVVVAHAPETRGDYVRLSVRDTGCGMSPEVLAQIFEPFFTTKPVGEGTGLGLATVFGIVQQNGGLIDVRSAPGEGTTFHIYLPRHGVATARISKIQTIPPQRKGHETILVVEDEPAMLRVTTRLLTRLGYVVVAAGSPLAALDLAREPRATFDLLLTDLIMPEMNGRDLATALAISHPTLKRLFMSGYTADVMKRHGVDDQEEAFLQKPFSSQSLAAKLREVLDDAPAE